MSNASNLNSVKILKTASGTTFDNFSKFLAEAGIDIKPSTLSSKSYSNSSKDKLLSEDLDKISYLINNPKSDNAKEVANNVKEMFEFMCYFFGQPITISEYQESDNEIIVPVSEEVLNDVVAEQKDDSSSENLLALIDDVETTTDTSNSETETTKSTSEIDDLLGLFGDSTTEEISNQDNQTDGTVITNNERNNILDKLEMAEASDGMDDFEELEKLLSENESKPVDKPFDVTDLM